MVNINDMRSLVLSHKILLDTSFAMQPGFRGFVQTYASEFRRNPLLVPALVLWELRKHCFSRDNDFLAQRSLVILSSMISLQIAEVRREQCDGFQDLVLLRVALQHKLAHSIVVLTNDSLLMRDLRAMWNCESVTSRKTLEVLKLHRRTQQLCVFRPHSWVSR
ncbi:MAG: hypothetical protein WKF77_22995 [Planctomycetaceae bacterium]